METLLRLYCMNQEELFDEVVNRLEQRQYTRYRTSQGVVAVPDECSGVLFVAPCTTKNDLMGRTPTGHDIDITYDFHFKSDIFKQNPRGLNKRLRPLELGFSQRNPIWTLFQLLESPMKKLPVVVVYRSMNPVHSHRVIQLLIQTQLKQVLKDYLIEPKCIVSLNQLIGLIDPIKPTVSEAGLNYKGRHILRSDGGSQLKKHSPSDDPFGEALSIPSVHFSNGVVNRRCYFQALQNNTEVLQQFLIQS